MDFYFVRGCPYSDRIRAMDCRIVDQRQDVVFDEVQSGSAGEQPDRTKERVAARLGRGPLLFLIFLCSENAIVDLCIASTAGAVRRRVSSLAGHVQELFVRTLNHLSGIPPGARIAMK
jgi:hypothetical protein